jgi:hypothetical protein
VTDKERKLLDRARQSPNNWTKAELEKLYEAFGFEIVRGTKHEFARHPKFPHLRGTLPNHVSFATGYIRSAVKLIDELNVLLEEEPNEGET